MAFDTFVEVFNTLYAVDLAGDIEGQTTGGMINNKRQEKKLAYERAQKSSASSFREGRCEGRWEGHRFGGRCGETLLQLPPHLVISSLLCHDPSNVHKVESRSTLPTPS